MTCCGAGSPLPHQRAREIPMRLLHQEQSADGRGASGERNGGGCLALFAAAEALGAGFVHGVPPHVYLPYLDSRRVAALVGMAPASPGEAPDLRLRQPSAPKSVFRGVVMRKGVPVCDLLQVWLDVASEPALIRTGRPAASSPVAATVYRVNGR